MQEYYFDSLQTIVNMREIVARLIVNENTNKIIRTIVCIKRFSRPLPFKVMDECVDICSFFNVQNKIAIKRKRSIDSPYLGFLGASSPVLLPFFYASPSVGPQPLGWPPGVLSPPPLPFPYCPHRHRHLLRQRRLLLLKFDQYTI